MKEQPFYIGQRVVAIKNFSVSGIKEGDVFTVINIKKFCSCSWAIDVGKANTAIVRYCKKCGHEEKTKIAWLQANFFAPITEGFEAISFEKVLENELSSVN